MLSKMKMSHFLAETNDKRYREKTAGGNHENHRAVQMFDPPLKAKNRPAQLKGDLCEQSNIKKKCYLFAKLENLMAEAN